MQEVQHPDGKVVRVFGDGRRAVAFPNGTLKQSFPDGRSVVSFSNGDVKRTLSDGECCPSKLQPFNVILLEACGSLHPIKLTPCYAIYCTKRLMLHIIFLA